MTRTWFDAPPGPAPSAPSGGYSVGRAKRDQGFAVLPVSVADDDLDAALPAAVQPGPLRYVQPDGSNRADPGWEIEGLYRDGGVDWDDIWTAPPADDWRLTHRTAATRQVHKTRYTCELDVAALLRRPFKALERYANDTLDQGAVVTEILVTDLSLESRVTHPVIGRDSRRLTVSACQGWRRWRVLEPEAAGIVSAAMRIAEFTAVGSLVTYGYGRVAVEPMP